VTLVLDGDEAGQRRTNEVLELFVAAGVDLRVLTLPAGLDPCDFLLEQGPDPMRELLGSAVDALEHAIVVETHGVDLLRDTHAANRALERILALVAKAPRFETGATSGGMLREQQVLARLSREFGMQELFLRRRLADLRRAASGQRADSRVTVSEPATTRDLDPFEEELLEILICHAELADAALLEISLDDLRSEVAKGIFSVYQRVGEYGEALTMDRVLSELENSEWKSLLITLEARASAKEEHACEDAAGRLRHLIDEFKYRREAGQRAKQMSELEKKELSEKEELEVLLNVLEQQRRRQGISAPTDG
jgi:DNA primase